MKKGRYNLSLRRGAGRERKVGVRKSQNVCQDTRANMVEKSQQVKEKKEKKTRKKKRNMASCILIVTNLRGCIRSKGRKKELR